VTRRYENHPAVARPPNDAARAIPLAISPPPPSLPPPARHCAPRPPTLPPIRELVASSISQGHAPRGRDATAPR
jgi:hypothetical protein